MKKKLLALILALVMVLSLVSVAGAATHVVQKGDNLSKLAEQYLGSRLKWREIYETNKDKISNPNDIYVGQKLTIPGTEEPEGPVVKTVKVDKSTQPRVLITTDLECDDMNGIILSLLFATDYDLAGIVWTAGKFHFSGDGKGTTFAQFCEEMKNFDGEPYVWTCEATNCGGTVENVGEVTEHRPVDPGFLTRIIDVSYRMDYEYLSKNNPNYPTPDELLSIAKVGNVEFEGDYRFDTEGSELIKNAILDDDPRPLYIMHWGGINTTVRALMSIYEEYYGTEQWDAIKEKVVSKVRLIGRGEDNCLNHSQLEDESRFGPLQNSDWSGFGGFTDFFAIYDAPDELKPYYQSEFLVDAFKFNHGSLMSRYLLMNDGQTIYGEPYCYQYGLVNYIDWTVCAQEGWANPIIGTILNFFPLGQRSEYDTYDWCCCQFGCASFVDLGLRQGINNRNNLFVEDMFQEWAARADWAVMDPEDCNHAPVVGADVLDYGVKPGVTVTLSGTAADPDGDELNITWWVPSGSWTYAAAVEGTELAVEGNGTTATFTVPADAVAGDRFVVNLEVQDAADRPMTRYVQYIITVVE